MLRIDGSLSTILDIDRHSEPTSFVLRSDENSGLMVKWDPHGPGRGQWIVSPVELLSEGDSLYITQNETGSVKSQTDILFSGSATVVSPQGGSKSLYGQSFGRIKGKVKDIVSHIVFRVQANRRRKEIQDTRITSTLDADPASRIQDEPWGTDWEDLKEQMQNVLDTGLQPSEASKRIREIWERDTRQKLTGRTAARLESQLKIQFRGE